MSRAKRQYADAQKLDRGALVKIVWVKSFQSRIFTRQFCFFVLAFLALAAFSRFGADAQQDPPVVIVEEPVACAIPMPDDWRWSDLEKMIWDELCELKSGEVNMQWYDTADEPLECRPDKIDGPVPENRQISGEFIRAILTTPALLARSPRDRFTIRCAQITDTLNLSYLDIKPALFILDSHFQKNIHLWETRFARSFSLAESVVEGDIQADRMIAGGSLFMWGGEYRGVVDLGRARISTDIELEGSIFEGEFSASSAEIKGSFFLRNGTVFRDDVVLIGAKVHGNLEASDALFEGVINADKVWVGASLFLSDGSVFKKDVVLRAGHIGSAVSAIGSTFEGRFDADSFLVEGSLFLSGGSVFKGDVVLRSASIGNVLSAIGSTFEGKFVGNRLSIGQTLFLRDGASFMDNVDIRSASIGSDVDASRSSFEREFQADSAKIGGSLFLRNSAKFEGRVNLLNAKIGGQLSAVGAVFEDEFVADGVQTGGSVFFRGGSQFKNRILLTASDIGSHLQFGASRFDGKINMTGAKVGVELLLSSPGDSHGAPTWGNDAELILRNVSTPVLQAEMHGWKRKDGTWLKTDLTGLRYDRFGGLNADSWVQSANMGDADAETLIAWIEEAQPDHGKRYDPQPYEQLAAALTAAGAENAAKAVRFARYEHRRTVEGTPPWDRFKLGLSAWVIGHGVYPFYLLAWFGALVFLGVVVAYRSASQELKGFWQKFWYSLENALPLVELKEAHKAIEHNDGLAEWVFHAQKVAGFVLATILVGALTLLGS